MYISRVPQTLTRALQRAGKQVLHLEQSSRYGGEFAVLTPLELLQDNRILF
jgi:RAB protein geranylgeranyltransferase component A